MKANLSIRALSLGNSLFPLISSEFSRLYVQNCFFFRSAGPIIRTNSPSVLNSVSFFRINGQALRFESALSVYSNAAFYSRISESNTSVIILQCFFENIDAGSNRGAVYIQSATNSATIAFTGFLSCCSSAGCAGVYAFSSSLNISFCCFYNCSGYYVSGSGYGGAGLYASGCTSMTCASSTFYFCNHKYSSAHGAFIASSCGGSLALLNFSQNFGISAITVSNSLVFYSLSNVPSNFLNFDSDGKGSDIVVNDGSGNTFSETSLTNCTSSCGAIVYTCGTDCTMKNCSFINNDLYMFCEYTANYIYLIGCSFSQSSSVALYNIGYGNYQLAECSFSVASNQPIQAGSENMGSCVMMGQINTAIFTAPSIMERQRNAILFSLCAMNLLHMSS